MTLANRHRVRIASPARRPQEADAPTGGTTLAGGDRSRIAALADALAEVPAVVHEFAEALPAGPVANAGRRVVVAVADGTWQVAAAGDGPSSPPHRGD